MQEALRECSPEWFRRDEGRDPDWEWAEEEDVRDMMRPLIADKADTAQFLASRGLVLTPESRDRFLDAVGTEFAAALKLLVKRASGDYTPDIRPDRFPKFAPAPLAPASGVLNGRSDSPHLIRLVRAAKRVERIGGDAGAVFGPGVVRAGGGLVYCERCVRHL